MATAMNAFPTCVSISHSLPFEPTDVVISLCFPMLTQLLTSLKGRTCHPEVLSGMRIRLHHGPSLMGSEHPYICAGASNTSWDRKMTLTALPYPLSMRIRHIRQFTQGKKIFLLCITTPCSR